MNFFHCFGIVVFKSNERVYFMIRVNNLIKTAALSTVMFGAGAAVATVSLSYLPIVNATPTKLAVGLKQSKGEEVDEKNNLKFRVQDCKRGGKTVVCNVIATNLKNENQKIVISWTDALHSRVIDSSGNQYIAKQTQIGSSIQKGNDGTLAADLIGNIPTKIIYSFEIPQEVTNLAAFEVNYRFPSSYIYDIEKVAIRDITIGGSQASSPSNPGTKCTCPPQTNPKKPRAK
jgi:hypothetical protein